jgi:hypothetical protein
LMCAASDVSAVFVFLPAGLWKATAACARFQGRSRSTRRGCARSRESRRAPAGRARRGVCVHACHRALRCVHSRLHLSHDTHTPRFRFPAFPLCPLLHARFLLRRCCGCVVTPWLVSLLSHAWPPPLHHGPSSLSAMLMYRLGTSASQAM